MHIERLLRARTRIKWNVCAVILFYSRSARMIYITSFTHILYQCCIGCTKLWSMQPMIDSDIEFAPSSWCGGVRNALPPPRLVWLYLKVSWAVYHYSSYTCARPTHVYYSSDTEKVNNHVIHSDMRSGIFDGMACHIKWIMYVISTNHGHNIYIYQ